MMKQEKKWIDIIELKENAKGNLVFRWLGLDFVNGAETVAKLRPKKTATNGHGS